MVKINEIVGQNPWWRDGKEFARYDPKLQRQETVARQILRAIVDRYGSRYSFSKLSRDIERTHITTIDYLEFMEDSFISLIPG